MRSSRFRMANNGQLDSEHYSFEQVHFPSDPLPFSHHAKWAILTFLEMKQWSANFMDLESTDNCSGQNKNSCMLQLQLQYLCMTGRHNHGGTKFAPDWSPEWSTSLRCLSLFLGRQLFQCTIGQADGHQEAPYMKTRRMNPIHRKLFTSCT